MIASRLVAERVGGDRVVFEEAQPGDKFYIVVRGSVEVLKRDPGGAQRRLAALQDGDFFGEMALLEDLPRSATVRTAAPSTFLTLDREQFLELLNTTPALRSILETVAQDRQQSNRRALRG